MEIGIIGGGIIGVTAAYELSNNHKVTLLEKQNFLGGLISSFKIDGKYDLDKFYRHIYCCDIHLIKLINQLGLTQDLIWNHSKMGVFYKKRLYSFCSQIDLLKFQPLNFLDKFKFAWTTLRISLLQKWKNLEQISAEDWLKKRVGKVYDVLWKPLLTSKFGEEYDQVGFPWFWSKICYRMQTRKRFFSKEVQGYLKKGFHRIIETMGNKIKENKSNVLLNSEVKKISRRRNKIFVETSKKTFVFDKVIFCADVPSFLKITKGLPTNYQEKLKKIKYRAALVLILKLKKSLMKYYWLNIADDQIPFVLAMEHTNFISKEEYGGSPLIYLSKYTSRDNEYYKMDKSSLIKAYIPHLKKINPNFNEKWIEDSWVFKTNYGTHIPVINYSKIIPENETPIKNLFLSTGCQIYPVDRHMSEGVVLGKKIAKKISESSVLRPNKI